MTLILSPPDQRITLRNLSRETYRRLAQGAALRFGGLRGAQTSLSMLNREESPR